MRIHCRFVILIGYVLISYVFYKIGRLKKDDSPKKYFLDGPNQDSGMLKIYIFSLIVYLRLSRSCQGNFQ